MYKILKIFSITLIFVVYLYPLSFSSEQKIKIGLLVPLTGEDKEIGEQIVKSARIALKDINSKKIEIFPKDTGSNPDKTIQSAIELKNIGVKVVIGPVFYKSLKYLDEMEDLIFVSLTNKTIDLPNNVISGGINATSQLNAIKKFIKITKYGKSMMA